jgi:hypothetical protein
MLKHSKSASSSGNDPEQLVEVYRTDNDIVAGLVAEEILGAAGIAAFRHDRRSHSIIAPASMSGDIGIAVEQSHAAAARKRLHEAKKDGILLDEGRLIEAEADSDASSGSAKG